MKKVLSVKEAVDFIKDDTRVMIGGFLECGVPDRLVDEIVERNIQNLTMITNDSSFVNVNKGKLIANKQIKKLITTHLGTNPEAVKQFNSKEMNVELVPMGTFVERMRAQGSGLGGFLTPTGVGTILEDDKETMVVDGKKYIFERPLGADVALIYGTKVDKYGNVSFYGTTRNMNTVMATAAETVIVQADELVDCLDPNEVVIPGLFIDYIVVREDN